MAKVYGSESDRRVRHRHRSLDRERYDEPRGERTVTLEPNAEEMRRRRIERLERSATVRDGRELAEAPNMATESYVTVQTSRRSSSRKRREHRRSPDERRPRRRTESAVKEEDSRTYVYGPPKERKAPPPVLISERRTLGRNGDSDESSSSESDKEPVRRSRVVREKPEERKVKVVYVKAKEDISTIRVKERRVRESSDTLRRPESVHRSSTHHTHRKSAPDAPPASLPRR